MISIERAMSQIDNNVRVICTDGQIIEGLLESVEDEEESGLGELGIIMMTPYGRCVAIPLSEIQSISTI